MRSTTDFSSVVEENRVPVEAVAPDIAERSVRKSFDQRCTSCLLT
jgi:hypothetical protein